MSDSAPATDPDPKASDFAAAASELPDYACCEDPESTGEPPAKKRVARKKVAFLLSFNGRDYFGMQRNPGWPTIEEEFLNAMLKAGYIDEDSFKTPQNAWFQRAARTDKGVSAVRQVVSIRMVPDDTAVETLNALLPPAVRVMGMRRVTRGFNPKTKCNARTYSYLMPSFAICPLENDPLTEQSRPSAEVRAEFDRLLKRFIGTHRFHNFTARRELDCNSNFRYIMDFDCGEPFEKDGMEWLLLKVRGQSFMLHQIRKMVGLCIAISRGFANVSVFDKVFQQDRIDVPIAPGLGLMLEQVHYDYYDEKFGQDGIHEALDWKEECEKVEEFRDSIIYESIMKSEKEDKSMLNWMSTLPLHTFGVRDSNVPSAQSSVRSEMGKAYVAVQLEREAKNSEDTNGEILVPSS